MPELTDTQRKQGETVRVGVEDFLLAYQRGEFFPWDGLKELQKRCPAIAIRDENQELPEVSFLQSDMLTAYESRRAVQFQMKDDGFARIIPPDKKSQKKGLAPTSNAGGEG